MIESESVGPEGQQIMARQMWDYLRGKAFGANAAGDGKSAQAAFNEELQRMGRPKLDAILGAASADEAIRLGRVLAFIKQVPEGAAPGVSGWGQFLTSVAGRVKGLKGLPYVNDYLVQPLGRYADRQAVKSALSGMPTHPVQLDPKSVEALASFFAAVPFAGGAAAAKPVR